MPADGLSLYSASGVARRQASVYALSAARHGLTAGVTGTAPGTISVLSTWMYSHPGPAGITGKRGRQRIFSG
jgi:hypothetical protein